MADGADARTVKFEQGLSAYEAGEFYEAHEAWEELWHDEEDDDARTLLQALIQIASALHKACEDVGPRGALHLLERAHGRLSRLPDDFGGIDVALLRTDAAALRVAVEGALAEGERLAPTAAPKIARTGGAPALRGRPRDGRPDPARQLAAGVAAYQRGEYFEAHELWEIVWRDETQPTMKSFLGGLILVAAAMHKLREDKSAAGALRLFGKALARLEAVPDGTGGMGIGRLRDDVERARAALEGEGRSDLEPSLVPRMLPVGAAPPS